MLLSINAHAQPNIRLWAVTTWVILNTEDEYLDSLVMLY